MKKLMSKSLGRFLSAMRILLRPIGFIKKAVTAKISPPIRIKLTRQNLMISLPVDQGAKLHILPRPGANGGRVSFSVEKNDESYILQASPDVSPLATYKTEQEAYQALAAINKALTGNVIGKWIIRLVLAWLIWLFATSYMEVSKQSAISNENVLGYEPSAVAPNIQTEPAQYQVTPSVAGPHGGDLSDYIYQQAMLAKDKAQKDALPPKTGTTGGSNGLAGFGLKAVNSAGTGVGCDPALAFKVPTK